MEKVPGGAIKIRQTGWRLCEGLDVPDAGARAWNRLWEGLAAAHNRNLSLGFSRDESGLSWRVSQA